jgi:hypothetical protein
MNRAQKHDAASLTHQPRRISADTDHAFPANIRDNHEAL